MLSPWIGTTRRCGLVGVGHSLVGGSEITVGVGFETLKDKRQTDRQEEL